MVVNKTFFKFLGKGLVIVLLGLAAIYAIDYYRYRQSPEYQAQKYFEDLRRQYEEDTYGGDTPEETLQLFIDALKKGDIELASKYFVIEDQEKQKEYFDGLKRAGKLADAIADGERLKLTKKTTDEAFFIIVGDKGVVEVQVVMSKNRKTDKWKISEL